MNLLIKIKRSIGKTNSEVVEPNLSSLQNSQSQTRAFVSATDELVETFSKKKETNFLT